MCNEIKASNTFNDDYLEKDNEQSNRKVFKIL